MAINLALLTETHSRKARWRLAPVSRRRGAQRRGGWLARGVFAQILERASRHSQRGGRGHRAACRRHRPHHRSASVRLVLVLRIDYTRAGARRSSARWRRCRNSRRARSTRCGSAAGCSVRRTGGRGHGDCRRGSLGSSPRLSCSPISWSASLSAACAAASASLGPPPRRQARDLDGRLLTQSQHRARQADAETSTLRA